MTDFKKTITSYKTKIDIWVREHYLQIGILNIFLILLFLLNSVGYFHPILKLNVQVIVFSGLIFSALFLGANSSTFFIVSLIFWIIALFFKLLKIDIWAERTVIYTFYCIILGMMGFFLKK